MVSWAEAQPENRKSGRIRDRVGKKMDRLNALGTKIEFAVKINH
jgi:hypothetical protein